MTAPTYLLALDQGTSSSRAIVFARDGRIKAMAQRETRQIYPQPGWVEHDPDEIWTSVLHAIAAARRAAKLTRNAPIAAIGVTNQRETVVLWDRRTGLLQAWRDLMRQYRWLFEIGAANRARGFKPMSLAAFMRDYRREKLLTPQYPATD